MYVQLDTLKPNPLRDFSIDPINEEVVEKLAESIQEDGFWGGVVCRRKNDGTMEIACGHHRVQAAIKAGYASANIFLAEHMDDDDMIRVYARENATQRGGIGTAMAGAVVAALRRLAKVLLAGTNDEVRAILGRGSVEKNGALEPFVPALCDYEISQIKAKARGKEGIGWHTVAKYLSDTGVSIRDIKDQLASTKLSGHYNIIIKEVFDEIKQEQEKILESLKEKAEAASLADEEAKR